MKRYKKVVMLLALKPGDEQMVRWGAKIAELAASEEVIFLHPMDIGDIPAKAKEKYPWLLEPLGEQALAKMKSTVEGAWEGPEATQVGYRVVDRASQALAVLEVTVQVQPDLVVIARDDFGHDLAIRLARKAPCSVMVIPGHEEPQLEGIMVPTDFSIHCEHALDVATAFGVAEGIRYIDSVHVYEIHRFAHRVTTPLNELRRLMEEYAKDEHDAFLARVDTKGIQVRAKQVCSPLTPQAICREAEESGCNLLVVGCRGKDTLTAMLLGSNAEELMRLSPVPVIASKKKGTGLQLLNAILGE